MILYVSQSLAGTRTGAQSFLRKKLSAKATPSLAAVLVRVVRVAAHRTRPELLARALAAAHSVARRS